MPNYNADEYNFSGVSVCSNPCVEPLPRIKISFFLSLIYEDKVIYAPKFITFLRVPLPNKKSLFLSNRIPYPEYGTDKQFSSIE